MHHYNIGDNIIWGKNNIGRKGSEHILVSAISKNVQYVMNAAIMS